jgi:hypothetical protein
MARFEMAWFGDGVLRSVRIFMARARSYDTNNSNRLSIYGLIDWIQVPGTHIATTVGITCHKELGSRFAILES